jgi:predicted RNase H-like HicB family nuclease
MLQIKPVVKGVFRASVPTVPRLFGNGSTPEKAREDLIDSLQTACEDFDLLTHKPSDGMVRELEAIKLALQEIRG